MRMRVRAGVTAFALAMCLSPLAASFAAQPGQLASGTYAVTVHNGGTVYRGTMTLQVKGSVITGSSRWTCCPGARVDPLSGTVTGSTVTIRRDCRGQGQTACRLQTFVGRIVTDPKDPAAGTLSGGWSGDGMGPANNTFTMKVRLKTPKVRLSGRVTCGVCGGTPVSGVRVVASRSGGGPGRATSGRDGRYAMRLAPGTYRVAVAGRRAAPENRVVVLERDVRAADFRTCPSAAGRRAAGAARSRCSVDVPISVVDLTGRPVAGVGVVAVGASSAGEVRDVTRPNGVATLTLPEGEWAINLDSSLRELGRTRQLFDLYGVTVYQPGFVPPPVGPLGRPELVESSELYGYSSPRCPGRPYAAGGDFFGGCVIKVDPAAALPRVGMTAHLHPFLATWRHGRRGDGPVRFALHVPQLGIELHSNRPSGAVRFYFPWEGAQGTPPAPGVAGVEAFDGWGMSRPGIFTRCSPGQLVGSGCAPSLGATQRVLEFDVAFA